MDRYPLQHDRNILHPSQDVNYICHYGNHVRHRHVDITISIRYSNLLGQKRLGFVRVRLGIRELIEFLNRVTHNHSILFSKTRSLLNKTRLYPNLFNNAALPLNTIPVNSNDCSMDFVLGGIARGLGYATLTIYMT